MSRLRYSFELYPPRDEAARLRVEAAVDAFAALEPEFVSVTFGAAGTSTSHSLDVLQRLLDLPTDGPQPRRIEGVARHPGGMTPTAGVAGPQDADEGVQLHQPVVDGDQPPYPQLVHPMEKRRQLEPRHLAGRRDRRCLGLAVGNHHVPGQLRVRPKTAGQRGGRRHRCGAAP